MRFFWCSGVIYRVLRFVVTNTLLVRCLGDSVAFFVIMNSIAHGEIVKIIAKLEKKTPGGINGPGII